MSSIKEKIISIVNEQPEDSSYEEILKELAFENMIQRGLNDSDSGRLASNDSVREMIKKWAK